MSAAAVSIYPAHRETVTILLVSPRNDDRESLQDMLGHSNWHLLVAPDCRTALETLRRNSVPVVICESNLPDGTWKDLFEAAGKLLHPPRLIVSSRQADDALWGEVLNLGCYDVLSIPFMREEVFRVACLAWHSWKLEHEQRNRTPRHGPSLDSPSTVGV